MGPFANAVNSFGAYYQTLPSQFCIDANNQDAFNRLNNEINNTIAVIQRGDNIFETATRNYYNEIVPLINTLHNTSLSITSQSHDFTPPLTAANEYSDFVKSVQTDLWNLTQTIEDLINEINSLANGAVTAFNNAVNQIEANVEATAQQFVNQNKAAEDAFKYWDTVNGQQGYNNFVAIRDKVINVMLPDFNTFRVPATQNIKTAFAQAQDAVNEIETGFASFPNFNALPTNSDYTGYGSADKQYGENILISAIQSIAHSYHGRTGRKLLVGNMQWEHGGYMSPHVSHKNGVDADIVGSDIGNVPNDDKAKALALAKEVLSTGATLVLFADQSVIDDANKWASENGLPGHMSFDSGHKDHFHIRMPIQGVEAVGKFLGERSGVVEFLNIHDYVGNTGLWQGCLSTLKCDDGTELSFYTTSERLQAALVMAYSTQNRVTISFSGSQEPYSVESVWTHPMKHILERPKLTPSPS